ncbi:hypothetical protein BS17DRAFT_171827 [Gyrodon lividus]|nr:hypothetical protein BS17DRAFT_171827 [Gyrodon lividus]
MCCLFLLLNYTRTAVRSAQHSQVTRPMVSTRGPLGPRDKEMSRSSALRTTSRIAQVSPIDRRAYMGHADGRIMHLHIYRRSFPRSDLCSRINLYYPWKHCWRIDDNFA